jgi:hypothetical protein
MGLLDDLKQQADSLREKQQVTQSAYDQNLQRAHAKLQEGLRYWLDLFNSLNIIKLPVPRYYYLEGGVTRLENLLQCDYKANARRLTIDHHDYVEAIELRFHCMAEGSLTLEKESEPMVRRLRDHLWANNLKFDVKEVRNERGYVERGIFTVKCEVPVAITIAADLDNAQIRTVTKNLEKLGEYAYLYDFDEFDRDVMEELGKVIVARPNTFRTMGRHQQAMTTPVTRMPRAQAEPPVEPPQPAQSHATEPGAKSLLGNIKSLLTR